VGRKSKQQKHFLEKILQLVNTRPTISSPEISRRQGLSILSMTRIFQDHIYQEDRRIRFNNYLNDKREEKQALAKEAAKREADKLAAKEKKEAEKAAKKAAGAAKKQSMV
jgi:pyruvate-formate lyase-activating enzyme